MRSLALLAVDMGRCRAGSVSLTRGTVVSQMAAAKQPAGLPGCGRPAATTFTGAAAPPGRSRLFRGPFIGWPAVAVHAGLGPAARLPGSRRAVVPRPTRRQEARFARRSRLAARARLG